MQILEFEKKPVRIKAAEFQGNSDQELADWCGGKLIAIGQGFWKIEIPTLEGPITASPCDYIIQGIQGEFYPCKPEIFHDSYRAV